MDTKHFPVCHTEVHIWPYGPLQLPALLLRHTSFISYSFDTILRCTVEASCFTLGKTPLVPFGQEAMRGPQSAWT